jgi:hypothetical protein
VALRPATLSANRTQDLQNLGGVVALDVNKLSFFAATTSAELAGVISDETGSGALVFAASPTLSGTPLSTTAAVDTNTTQIATTAYVVGQASATNPLGLGTAAIGTSLRYARQDHVHPTTGLGLTSGTLAQFASTTSSQLAGVISDETGSGALVFATSPSLTTPTLGVASATSINKVAITAPATSATLTIANGKTLTASNTLTFTGTDASSVAFGAGGTVAYTANKLSVFAATTSAELAGVISDETGSGALVFATSPTLVTPAIGVATGTSFNGITGLSSTNPAALGAVAVGTGTTVARADHVHPTTGLGLTSGTLAQFAATTSAQLAGVITNETGTGLLVFNTSPSLTTPAIGAATGSSLTLTGAVQATQLIATSATSLRSNVKDSSTFIAGDDNISDGGNLLLYGSAHPSLANNVRIRQGTTDVFRVTEVGALTVTATGTNQNITLAPSGTGIVNAPTFNATSATGNGFQGIAADSVSLPSFAWTGETNTGLYRPTAGAVGVTSAGAEVVRFDRAGTSGRRRALFTTNTEIECTAVLFLEGGTDVRSITIANTTTATAANVVIGTANGLLQRSTSSLKYKTEVETAELSLSEALVYGSEPVWYRSLCENDPEDWSYWGFIAEEVAEIDPRMVHWGDDGPESVQYDRYVVHLVNVIQKQKQQLDAMEARIIALEGARS